MRLGGARRRRLRPAAAPGVVGVFGGHERVHRTWHVSAGCSTRIGRRGSACSDRSGWATTRTTLATRVAYKLNLRGPSVTVQTACSTSLVAVARPARACWRTSATWRWPAGVASRYRSRRGYLHQEGGIFSPDGHCRAFDADAAGHRLRQRRRRRRPQALSRRARRRRHHPRRHPRARRSTTTAPRRWASPRRASRGPGRGRSPRRRRWPASTPTRSPTSRRTARARRSATRSKSPALTKAFRAQTSRAGFCALGSVKTNIRPPRTAAAGVAGPDQDDARTQASGDCRRACTSRARTRLPAWERHRLSSTTDSGPGRPTAALAVPA